MKQNTPILLLLWSVLMATQLNGQNCGTEVTVNQYNLLSRTRIERQSFDSYRFKTSDTIPIALHIVRKSDGSDAPKLALLKYALNNLNSAFTKANIVFTYCGEPEYIDDDRFYNFRKADEPLLADSRDEDGAINVYITQSITNFSGSQLCGYTYMPGAKDRIFMSSSCLGNGTTFAHEMGHYLSLYHTHGVDFNQPELVNGSNCEIAGDEICDTPADPNLLGEVDNCTYDGNKKDANGDLYQPDVHNIMSYSVPNCRYEFSDGQIARMQYSIENDHPNLKCNNKVASFLANPLDEYSDISIYPNPTQGMAQIKFSETIPEGSYISIYNAFGKLMKQQVINPDLAGGVYQFDLSGFGKGIYFVYLKNGTKISMKKLLYQ